MLGNYFYESMKKVYWPISQVRDNYLELYFGYCEMGHKCRIRYILKQLCKLSNEHSAWQEVAIAQK